jgi:integrative and conjugative element protein (TIGR02256 family)
MVLPYSRVVSHAALLAEQIQLASTSVDAAIRAWSRDPDSGTVTTHVVPAATEREVAFDDISVFLDAGLEAKLREYRAQGLPAETGGILIGYIDLNIRALMIVDALPPPPDSKASTTFFERGTDGLVHQVTEASRRTSGVVGYVGEWHTHPGGHSSQPSGQDLRQLVYLALGMADDGLPAVSVIVGETDIRVLQGVVAE